jgi:Septum formation
VAKIGCDRPHEYEVMRSGRLPANASTTYPPPVSTVVRPICRSTLPVYLRSADADASRLETVSFWPTEAQWNNGDRWYACLLVERGTDNKPTRRTGRLAGALAGGLGAFQRCQVDKPLSSGPLRIVPCDRPHQSEAVPGVLVLGKPADPPPDPMDMATRYVDHCTKAVNTYLGGPRPGVTPSSVGPLPQDWRTGTNTLVCFAVTKTRVTGSLRDR